MIEEIYQIFLNSTGVCTDTRNIKEGNLFIALKGPNFNANSFAKQALEKGAIAAIIDDKQFEFPGKTVLVQDGLTALQDLARHHRKKLTIPIIGITGSNGKTTSKELIHALLNSKYNTFSTHGNLNNHIGVPLSVLAIHDEHELAIIEMGANHVGEIGELCQICQPTHGLITNIGKAHIGLFGGFEGVIRAKSELYNYLIKHEGVIFVNQNQEILMNMSKRMRDPVFYPNADSYYPCALLDADPFVRVRTDNNLEITSQLSGKYNFDNIATALCLGKFFQVEERRAAQAIENYLPSNNRSQIVKKGSNTILLDAYNANPSSMEKAIETLAQSASKNKVAIVGDMYELGEETKKEHQNIGKLLDKHGIHEALFCGEFMKYAHKTFAWGLHFEKKTELIEHLKKHPFKIRQF
jgi:UDP-N-acetylmuramoyl-tripeptide--D-alanyl-D-alanine ligase